MESNLSLSTVQILFFFLKSKWTFIKIRVPFWSKQKEVTYSFRIPFKLNFGLKQIYPQFYLVSLCTTKDVSGWLLIYIYVNIAEKDTWKLDKYKDSGDWKLNLIKPTKLRDSFSWVLWVFLWLIDGLNIWWVTWCLVWIEGSID